VWRLVAGWWHFAAAAVVAFGAAAWTYRPWTFGSAAMFPGGDGLQLVAWAQNTAETGWYETGGRLAAPFVANDHSFTVTDELYFGLIKLLGPVFGSPAGTVQWLLVLSFPAAAITATLLARHLGVSKVAAAFVGVAFAVHIDHFTRGFGHFMLAMTWVIPIGVLAAVSLIHPPRHTGRRRVAWEAALVVGLVATGFSSAYYVVFTGVLVAVAGLAAAWTRRSWRYLALPVGRGLALTLPVLIAMAMDKAFLPRSMGYEAMVTTRGLADSELYGGKITAMLLPSSFHRVPALRELRHSYDAAFPNYAEGPALGVVAAVGFVGLVIWGVMHFLRPTTNAKHPVIGTLTGLTIVSLLVYVTGGLGTVWAILLQGGGLRVWSRMHVVIALLGLLAVAVMIDRLRGRWVAVAAGALTVVVLLDGTSPFFRPNAATATALEAEARDLTAQISDDAGADAAIFQYPVVTFPVQDRDTSPASAYDGFLPYVYSDDLRWSYGGLQGDPAADWQQELTELPEARQAALLRAGGFSGVLVDTVALTSAPEELESLRDALGEPTITSASGRWLYFPLTGAQELCSPEDAQTARDLAVRPVIAYAGEGMEYRRDGGANDGGAGALRLVTLREAGWADVTVTFSLSTEASLRLEFPDGTSRDYPPGLHDVRWTGDVQNEDVLRIVRTGGEEDYAVTQLDADVARTAGVRDCLVSSGQAEGE
jgi:phosphoglycerol transferase